MEPGCAHGRCAATAALPKKQRRLVVSFAQALHTLMSRLADSLQGQKAGGESGEGEAAAAATAEGWMGGDGGWAPVGVLGSGGDGARASAGGRPVQAQRRVSGEAGVSVTPWPPHAQAQVAGAEAGAGAGHATAATAPRTPLDIIMSAAVTAATAAVACTPAPEPVSTRPALTLDPAVLLPQVQGLLQLLQLLQEKGLGQLLLPGPVKNEGGSGSSAVGQEGAAEEARWQDVGADLAGPLSALQQGASLLAVAHCVPDHLFGGVAADLAGHVAAGSTMLLQQVCFCCCCMCVLALKAGWVIWCKGN